MSKESSLPSGHGALQQDAGESVIGDVRGAGPPMIHPPSDSSTTSTVATHREDQTIGQTPQNVPPHYCEDHATMHM